ncbi:hypothetical protein PQX77_006636 [Marasmius sp. AFHP31]|nr:hypothetical protein PQX77_006636 [Marasmius sp. AFHP31]
MNFNLQHLERQQDVFWFPGMGDEPPPVNFTPGMVTLLRKALTDVLANGGIKRAVLCSEDTVYVNRMIWDLNWGKCYRLFTMLCTALIGARHRHQNKYRKLLMNPTSPGVRNLQNWIENAWENGYDEEGCELLQESLINTSKLLSLPDLWAAFVSRRLPAHFATCFPTVPTNIGNASLTWIKAYFDQPRTSESGIQCTSKMPILFAFSTTEKNHHYAVVGYEVDGDENINLLVFDPERVPDPSLRRYLLDHEASTQPDPVAYKTALKLCRLKGSWLVKNMTKVEILYFKDPLEQPLKNDDETKSEYEDIVTLMEDIL